MEPIIIIHKILTMLLLVASVAIFLSANPVHSILYLILCFCFSSIILFLFEVEFLGLLFIMIYVGAVAILFLFVVMMINTKRVIPNKYEIEIYSGIALLINIVFIKLRFFFHGLLKEYPSRTLLNGFYYNPTQFFSDGISNIETVGQTLFNNYGLTIPLGGFVLIIALIGCIRLTIEYKEIKRPVDKTTKPLSRNEDCIHKFK